MIKKILCVTFLFLSSFSFAGTILPYDMQEYDNVINQYYQNPKSHSDNILTRIETASAYFLGKKYLNNALGEGPDGEFDQSPLYRTDMFDCTTYVSTVLALVESNNLSEFKATIKKINYHTDDISYFNRNHFIELEWNEKNQNNHFLKDMTASIQDLSGQSFSKSASIIIHKPAWYLKKTTSSLKYIEPISASEEEVQLQKLHDLSKLATNERATISYVPLHVLFEHDEVPNQFLFDQIPNGSIIEIVGSRQDFRPAIGTSLLVSHMGIAIRDSRGLIFREASLAHQAVVDVPLIDYLKNDLQYPGVKGIHIQQIN